MSIKKLVILIWFSIALIFGFLIIPQAFAAELSIKAASPAENNELKVDILLDSNGEEINAIEATLVFPANILQLKNINDGDSVISLWIRRPQIGTSSSAINFSGIIPGGYSGKGKIFQVTFAIVGNGFADFALRDARVLLNDGVGSAAKLILVPYSQAVQYEEGMQSAAPPQNQSKDVTPPEQFTPEISSDSGIFAGKYFITFSSLDKGSGIDHYEVLEVSRGFDITQSGMWKRTESPYLLLDQSLQSDVYVRAVDREGNFTIVKISGKGSPLSLSKPTEITFVILLLLLLGCGILGWYMRSRRLLRL